MAIYTHHYPSLLTRDVPAPLLNDPNYRKVDMEDMEHDPHTQVYVRLQEEMKDAVAKAFAKMEQDEIDGHDTASMAANLTESWEHATDRMVRFVDFATRHTNRLSAGVGSDYGLGKCILCDIRTVPEKGNQLCLPCAADLIYNSRA